MVRLSVSKREKGRRKRASVMSSQLHSLTHFSDISALTGGAPHLDEVRQGCSGGRQLLCLRRVLVRRSAQPFLLLSPGPESCEKAEEGT